jgi:hypothetical protein
MPSKQVNQTITTIAAVDAQYTIDVADNHDDGTNHPGCAYVNVKLRDGEYQTVWLQNVTRNGSGVVTGKVPAPGGPLTGAELTTLRASLTKIFNAAATAAGYT